MCSILFCRVHSWLVVSCSSAASILDVSILLMEFPVVLLVCPPNPSGGQFSFVLVTLIGKLNELYINFGLTKAAGKFYINIYFLLLWEAFLFSWAKYLTFYCCSIDNACRYFVAALSVAGLYGIISTLLSVYALLKPDWSTRLLSHLVIFDVVSLPWTPFSN